MASQIARIFFIDQRIRSAGSITLKEIMEHADVASATAKRDIETLKYTIKAPIIYNRKIRAYIYENEFTLLNYAGEQLFLFYVLARGAVQNKSYLPLSAEYARETISEKIKEILPVEFQEISQNFQYISSDYEKIDYSLLSAILESMVKRQQCELEYLTKGKSGSLRLINPLKVMCYGTKWYLIAFCHKNQGLRTFLFSRIKELILKTQTFDPQKWDNELTERIESSFGVARGDSIQTATIKFSDPSSYYVKDQIWHSEQVTSVSTIEDEFVVEFQLPYAKPEELIGKVLKYGATAEILKPGSLRALWIREIEMMCEKYLKTHKGKWIWD
jgi:predicted DNA-binding transcriptional regulator YafY